MRQILIEAARARNAQKRGADFVRVTLDERVAAGTGPEVDVLAVDAALTRLAALDAVQARLVSCATSAG